MLLNFFWKNLLLKMNKSMLYCQYSGPSVPPACVPSIAWLWSFFMLYGRKMCHSLDFITFIFVHQVYFCSSICLLHLSYLFAHDRKILTLPKLSIFNGMPSTLAPHFSIYSTLAKHLSVAPFGQICIAGYAFVIAKTFDFVIGVLSKV